MTYNYVIYTDASADIDLEIVKEKGIRFVPMSYSVGEEERRCTCLEEEAFLKKFYDAQREGKETHTSQVTPHSYMEEFAPVLKEGISVLYLSLSSGLTQTYNSVRLAAVELAEEYTEAKVVAVDTLCATAGMGLLLEMAVKHKEEGMSLEDNAAWLEENRLNVAHFFMVDDLMYLKRGGRIPATTAILGTALNIKPVLKIEKDGTLATYDKKRGTKQAIKELAAKYAANRNDAMSNKVYIVHADCEDNALELKKQILAINGSARISTMMLCPIIGAHVGPGMMAVIFFGTR